MLELRMTMRPRHEKMRELLQTLGTLATGVSSQWGCMGFTFHNEEKERMVILVETWSDRAAVDAYLGSREHRALLGAIETLCEYSSALTESRQQDL